MPAASSKNLVLAAMVFAVAMTFIDQTIVAIATPQVAEELSLSRSGSAWVINAYLLALAAGFALGGRLADVIGSKKMVLVGIVGFATTSLLCGLTPTGDIAEPWIITFRALQGLSAALMIPAAPPKPISINAATIRPMTPIAMFSTPRTRTCVSI